MRREERETERELEIKEKQGLSKCEDIELALSDGYCVALR